MRNGKICHFWAEPTIRYWYQKRGGGGGGGGGGVPVPIAQRQSGTGTGASSNPVFLPLALLSLVFVHRLFKDPNKGLMGVHIRVYERENVLYLAALAIFV